MYFSTDGLRKLGDVFLGPQRTLHDRKYLEGIRGVLVIESFLWVVLQTFLPNAVKDSNSTAGPRYQTILRYTLSVLFWNETLIYSTFILISARTICLPFLQNSGKTSVASAAFRRGIRLWFPVAVSLAIVKGVFSSIGTDYIERFKEATGNSSLITPYTLRGTLAYFNAVFDLFWTNFNFSSQAGSKAFPTGTLWIVNVIYMQSYTVYMTMIIIPYTRSRWRVQALILFIVTAWWVQSWAWYSITGLLLADAVTNMDFKSRSQRGIPIWRISSFRFPTWPIYTTLMAVGLAMQYLWTAWRPQSGNIELIGHAGLYYTGGLNTQYNVIEPQARDDNYVFLLGFFLLVETSDTAQKLFSAPLLTYLGNRSLSYFLLQSLIVYTGGFKLFLALHVDAHHLSYGAAASIASLVCLAGLIPAAELFHRVVDCPSRMLALRTFEWMRE